jgi:hypothetical protein
MNIVNTTNEHTQRYAWVMDGYHEYVYENMVFIDLFLSVSSELLIVLLPLTSFHLADGGASLWHLSVFHSKRGVSKADETDEAVGCFNRKQRN